MSNKRKYKLGIAVGLIAMIAAIGLPLKAKTMWLYLSGAVIPSSHRTQRYTDKPFRVMSVTGQRWVTWNKLEDASAYYALVVLPLVMPDDNDFESGGNGFTHTDIERWQQRKGQFNKSLAEERELAVTYDAVWQTITVGSRRYRLANGNLFVIRYDENWRSEVTQLEATINHDAELGEVTNAFKSALSEDKAVKQL